MFYSDSVLQRITIADLSTYLGASKNASSPGALHLQKIDCKDFFSIGCENEIPPLYYLTIKKRVWESVTCRFLNYQNRLRAPEFMELFLKCGFQVQISNPVRNDLVTKYVDENLRNYHGLPTYDIDITSFSLVGKVRCD